MEIISETQENILTSEGIDRSYLDNIMINYGKWLKFYMKVFFPSIYILTLGKILTTSPY